MLNSQSQSLFASDPFRLQDCQPTESSEEFLSSMDGIGSYLPAADQYSNTFWTDLSWDDWLSLGLVAEPNFNMPHECPLPHNSASSRPSLDSNASSDQLTSQGWPMNFLEDPQLNFPSCPQPTVQQAIESCVPHLPQPSTIETFASPPAKQELPSANTKKPISPTKRNHGLRTKPEKTPTKDPPAAKKEPKPKSTTTTSTRAAHSIIEHKPKSTTTTSTSTSTSTTSTSTRTAHSVIEHNYRKNLNTKMEQLRQILSVADSTSTSTTNTNTNTKTLTSNSNSPSATDKNNNSSDIEDNNNKTAPPNSYSHSHPHSPTSTSQTITRKSDVLIHAYGYVKRSECEKKSMADENAFLKRRLVALEKLVSVRIVVC